MILIVCVDDDGGMAFNGRRQSRDRFLCDRILNKTFGGRLRISPFSASLFREYSANWIEVDENCLENAGEGEFCFVENVDPAPYEERCEKIMVYRWNRKYPADVFFGIRLKKGGWKMDSSVDFAGYSHEKITEEIFVK